MASTSCAGRPVKVGLPLVLTGLTSRLGVQARNGALLAEEAVNASGGIRGRPLELVVEDDGDDPDRALAVDRELAGLGVVALVGHMSSRSALKAADFADSQRLPLLSPTVSSTLYSGKDDYFFRIIGSNDLMGRTLASYARKAGFSRVSVVWEEANRSYTETFFRGFKEQFEAEEGRVISDRSFLSKADFDFRSLVNDTLAEKPDAIFVVASSFDTASVCQILQSRKSSLPVLACMWAMTDDLFKFGGRSVDRVIGVMYMDPEFEGEAYRDFCARYQRRYGEPPDFGAVYGYDAVTVMAEALSRAHRLDGPSIKEALIASRPVEGLQGSILIDRFGDSSRKPFVFDVRGGAFHRVE